MIFSHFKRRRGIRFDDGFRHSAREPALDPLVATYDAILATNPTVPVLLQLTEYRGQQVLWQDPECTIPVADIGDPIGGVRHPETGDILVVQTTDADRPVWGGLEVGADFRDGDYYLLRTDTDEIPSGQSYGNAFATNRFDGLTNRILNTRDGEFSSSAGNIFAQRRPTVDRFFWEDDSGDQLDIQPPNPGGAAFQYQAAMYNAETPGGEYWLNGELHTEEPLDAPLDDITQTVPVAFGGPFASFGGFIRFWVSYIGDPVPHSDLAKITSIGNEQ